MAISAILLAISTPASPAQPTGQLIADRLEVAFKACAQQLTERNHLTAANKKVLTSVGIGLNKAPPADVAGMAARLFGTDGIYATVSTPEGEIWIAASGTVPACKVTLANTALGLTARMAWTDKLHGTQPWSYDKARSGMNGGLMRDTFVLNPDRPGGHMIAFLDGPNTVWQDGKGIQMIMTVALETAKAQ